MKSILRAFYLSPVVFFFTIGFLGCDEAAEPGTGGKISLSVRYTPAPTLSKKTIEFPPGVAAVDSIRITRARFLLREIEFESALGDSLEYEAGPLILELNLNGSVNTIAVGDVPLGTYDEIEFDIHRIDPDDHEDSSAAALPSFQDFVQGERYSIIVDGTVFRLDGAVPFQFRSKINEEQEYELNPPLVVGTEGQVVNVTLIISSANWFRAPDGSLLDPTDPNNESQISNNLKASIKPVKDDDKDGDEDGD